MSARALTTLAPVGRAKSSRCSVPDISAGRSENVSPPSGIRSSMALACRIAREFKEPSLDGGRLQQEQQKTVRGTYAARAGVDRNCSRQKGPIDRREALGAGHVFRLRPRATALAAGASISRSRPLGASVRRTRWGRITGVTGVTRIARVTCRARISRWAGVTLRAGVTRCASSACVAGRTSGTRYAGVTRCTLDSGRTLGSGGAGLGASGQEERNRRCGNQA